MQVEHDLTASYPLSPQQRRLWSLQQEGSGAYRVQGAILLEGALDLRALTAALRDVVARQEVLRTTFAANGSRIPVQHANANGEVELREYDLRSLDGRRQEEEVAALLRETRLQDIAGSESAGLRCILLRQAAVRNTLLVNLSALRADAATLRSLVYEIGARYAARLEDEAPPDDAMQYADLSEWQNGLLAAEDARGDREFWRRQWDRPSVALRMPLERKVSAHSPFLPETIVLRVEARVAAGLDELAAKHRISHSVLLLTCWHILLCRLTGQSRLTVGVAFDGRSYEGLERAMGPLTKYLPLLTSFAGSERFSEHLQRIAESVKMLSDRQEYFSWEHVLSEPGEAATTPYLPLCYEHNEYRQYHPPDAGLTLSLTHGYACVDRFKIKLSCTRADALITEFHFDADLYAPADIERLSDEFHTILRSVVRDPESAIDRLPILGNEERGQILKDFNRTSFLKSPDLPMHRLFERQAARTPSARAVSCGEVLLTYAELDQRAERVAARLRSARLRPGGLVGLCVPRSAEMLVGLLGIWKAGGAYVPLDPEYPVERLRLLMRDAGARVLVTWGEAEAAAREVAAGNGTNVLVIEGPEDEVALSPEGWEIDREAGVSDLAYVIYTSGSTGIPKGVCVEHHSVASYLGWVNETLLRGAVRSLPVVTSLSFDMCLKQVLPPLLTGNEVWLVPEEVVNQPEALLRALCARPQFGLNCIPSLWKSILDSLDPAQANALTGRLVFLAVGGERLTESLVERTFGLFPQLQLWNIYGPTEVTANATATIINAGDEVTIGRPIANVQVYILDQYAAPVPIGVVGEVYVGGNGVARGYQSRPELTAERFIPNPFGDEPGGRLYRTGDHARFLPNGTIDFVGRADHQVKVRGYRIELGEIEAVLEQHPGICEAVVLVREDKPADLRLVAYAVPEPQHIATAGQIREYLQTKLPGYMVPAFFVTLDSLPLTLNGKVDRSALPAPELAESTAKATIAPRTFAEQLLVDVWSEVLGLDAERLSIEDNFFELGGDSILSIQVVARAGRRGLRFTPRQLFDHQTIEELAASIGAADPGAASPVAGEESRSHEGEVPLTPIQRWFFEQEQFDPHHFNQAVLLRTSPELSVDVLRRALTLLVARHDALRLRFKRDESTEWRQWVAGADEANELTSGAGLLWQRDLTHVTEGEDFVAVVEHECELAQASLDLERGPVARAVHFQGGVGRWGRLLIVVHHLAVDGVSWRVLLEELSELVEALADGKEPAPSPQTATWASWSRALVSSAADARQELQYWRSLPWTRGRRLPVDSAGVNTVRSAHTVERELTQAETAELLRLVAAAYRARVDEALLAALARAYPRWQSGRGDVADPGGAGRHGEQRGVLLIDVEGHGREVERVGVGLDLTHTVGWFTSLYPVALELAEAAENVGRALLRAKEAVRGTPGRGVGWGLLRYVCDGKGLEEVRGWPRAEVGVNYLGRFDNVVSEGGRFAPAAESAGSLQSERGIRQRLFDINSIVMNGRLRVSWTYSENLHGRETVEQLADLHLEELRAVVEHCRSPEAGGFTPSDFPEANLNQKELDQFISLISRAAGE